MRDATMPVAEMQTAGDQPADERSNPFSLATVTLPKGGGAIRGIGEKFGANPVNGTASLTVPIAVSPGRSGLTPELTLSYNSGSGNGPFGFGWSLSLPSITRRTEKGLPQYLDDVESDVFVLSGSEDLVPALDNAQVPVRDATTVPGYTIDRYRPRVEGLFARIERWTRADGDAHWRVISKDNVLSVYGLDADSRIVDETSTGPRVFSWLLCEIRDDKGNVVAYEYKREGGDGADLSRACERNRGPRNDPRRATARYIKHIRYGNRKPLLDQLGRRPRFLTDLPSAQLQADSFLFEVVFDYGEHNATVPRPGDSGVWGLRIDPFSTYRAGFEVRTSRLCRRVLMFHHFPEIAAVGADCLVRSTDFDYGPAPNPDLATSAVYSMMRSVSESGYVRQGVGYLKRDMPPLELEYTRAEVQDTVEDVDPASVENLPVGVDGTDYQWTDLHGEGIPGILTEQADAWFYKRNLSPIADGSVVLGSVECVATRPALALAGGRAQFVDLAGDGQPDLVVFDGPTAGFYEHDDAESWQPFRAFSSQLARDMHDPNLRFVDLDGDGHPDVMITEEDAIVWYPSLEEEGFGPARRVVQPRDEERGPRVVFADGAQSIHLADMSGDGLSDVVRVRNNEICYWPSLGYGRFGDKVTMDHAPRLDAPDQFNEQRVRLADIDGTGTTDLLYLHRDGVRLYANQSGNSWSSPRPLAVAPRVDDLESIATTDLLGNGTACLVWSSPLPADAGRVMRFVDLMGGQKPHLLVKVTNNLGAETTVQYAPSTKFYLRDRRDGKPWITRLPFPVHVVERVETLDRVSRNRFVTRYAYHHGYFDGVEREFRGFGMVEQFDTEELAALTGDGALAASTNSDPAFNIPPVLTKTWFHTGVYIGRDHVSNYFAGLIDANDTGEYYREPATSDAQARALLLPDTLLPAGLTLDEEREACRALKGSMLRREVYALDGTLAAKHPYTVIEQNFQLRTEQPQLPNRYAVFFAHPGAAITYHYERNPSDPRVQHALTLEVDAFGNVLKEAAVGYGRRQPDSTLPLQVDRDAQTATLVTFTEHRVTNGIDATTVSFDDYRAPLPCETRTYELTGFTPTDAAGRFQASDLVQSVGGAVTGLFDSELEYEDVPTSGRQRRSIAFARKLYRRDDLTALLALGQVQALALPGEDYELAFTRRMLTQVFTRAGQSLVPAPAAVLGGQGRDGGGYQSTAQLEADGRFPAGEPAGRWWRPSGRVYLSPGKNDLPGPERDYARDHFFVSCRFRDPFHTATTSTESSIVRDGYDLLPIESRDAVGNRVTVGERAANGLIDATKPGNDYRVLQPSLVTDPNGNRTQVAFDALGLVVGTAVMGKPTENLGDSLAGFVADLPEAVATAHVANPLASPGVILGRATTRLVYDLFAYQRSVASPSPAPAPRPAVVATIARETHDADLGPGDTLRFQHGLSCSDGFGREIQKKLQAEPGPLIVGGPVHDPRWVGTGWTIFNNKGKPVRQYEPFFSTTSAFEFGALVGVSPILFYDPIERVVATLHPNDTYEKVVFDPWQQVTWDVNDTVLDDPRTDADVAGYTGNYFAGLPASPPAPPWQTWYQQRQGGSLGSDEQASATKAKAHAGTPTTACFDTLGRTFLTIADNGPDPASPGGVHRLFASSLELDIDGRQRAVRDAVEQAGDQQGRVVAEYVYDLLGRRVHQVSMDAGTRWALEDATGKSIRGWDSRGHDFRTEYDPARRPIRSFVVGADPADVTHEVLVTRVVYGEQHPNAEHLNLRGGPAFHFDQAGMLVNEGHDFKGNPLSATRKLTNGTRFRDTIDWHAVDADQTALPDDTSKLLNLGALSTVLVPWVELDGYTNATTYDALNRVTTITTPHAPTMKPSTIRHGYNEANLLERVEVNLRAAPATGGPLEWTTYVRNIDYDAKGQRQQIDYGNRVSTIYDYDPLTFRLVGLVTRRDASTFPDDARQPPPSGWPGTQVQNLAYSYDPVGNVTSIRDDAQQAVFFRNKRVEASADYIYDAMYRLSAATGREHLGQLGGAPIPHSANDGRRCVVTGDGAGNFQPNIGDFMGTYDEEYLYDAVGNLLQMAHHGRDPANPGWTRTFAYLETSLIEDGTASPLTKQSNRLSSTTVTNGGSVTETYVYDAHGNTTRMPHLGGGSPAPNMVWDHDDQLRAADLGGGGVAYFVYDSAGQRVRKVWEKAPTSVDERVYLGGFEIFRRRQGSARLQRESFHVMDDKQRIALVETRTLDTAGTDPGLQEVVRYQFGNHLGSACLELDDQAQIITYEEYSPYGSTTYQAVRSSTETSKRYRYTGKERDEESGLSYHGARYYAPWLARWTSCDPAGEASGLNAFLYVAANPARLFDPNGKDWRDSLSITQRVALWVDETVIEPSPVARGIVKNLEKRGEALLKAPSAVAEKYKQEGFAGVAKSLGAGVKHLVTDTVSATRDVVHYGGKALRGDAKAKEIVASRGLDIVLNVADLVTMADGAGAAKNAVVGSGKLLAAGGKSVATTVKEGIAALKSGGSASAETIGTSGAEVTAATAESGEVLAEATEASESSFVDLTTPEARGHILDGEVRPDGTFSGGHRPGAGFPGKSEFPGGWSDEKILHEISDVATSPSSSTITQGSRSVVSGTRDGVDIRVIVDTKSGEIVTGYPTNVIRNP